MNRYLALLASTLGFVAFFAACGGGDDIQTVQPQTRGERGETCLARNDCEAGLACINSVCSKNDFDVSSTAKHCDRIDCSTNEDCCGDKPSEAPAKCANRASICQTPTLPGCTPSTCTSDAQCGAGECGRGFCSNSSASCDDETDCAGVCSGGFCSGTGNSCTTAGECDSGTCQSRSCQCQNPAYEPTDPICSDPECTDVCVLKCDEEQCVPDVSCEVDSDCLGNANGRICDAGRCVECNDDEQCLGDNDSCVNNVCTEPCTQNEQCPLFHSCTDGECVESGCTSDRECILAAGRGSGSREDARLSKCLPSADNKDIKECKIPCENDGACGSELEVCEAGFCKFVGCDSDEECRTYLGIENQNRNGAQPFVSRAVCRE